MTECHLLWDGGHIIGMFGLKSLGSNLHPRWIKSNAWECPMVPGKFARSKAQKTQTQNGSQIKYLYGRSISGVGVIQI
jgi:hypothetical protein